MPIVRRQFLRLAVGVTALPALPRVATAQAFPSRPITFVVPFPAGGPNDAVGRIMAERMRVFLGQPVVVENVAGAAGSIGVGRVARAPPDGYTIAVGQWGTHVINGAIYKLSYDVLNDFEPIGLVADSPFLIVAKKTLPPKNLMELIYWLKTNPDKASQGTAGVGAASHVAGILLQAKTATRFHFVPYRGAAPAMQDLVAGQIDLMIDTPATSLPQVRAGLIKGFAVTAKSRLPSAPEIPTAEEAGVLGYYASVWIALFAPKNTPEDVVTKLNAAVLHALADPVVRARYSDLSLQIPNSNQQSPEALRAFQRAEIEKWWPIIKAANIKVE
ncbi:MAG: tripartite tricarboxylate transporter substrate-binding protein [Candidatus Korobacteraceae bacterium]